MIALSERQSAGLGYRSLVYDLGGLDGHPGGRIPFDYRRIAEPILVRSFRDRGFYQEIQPGWRTRALHKPFIVADCLERGEDLVTYLDGDAILLSRIDEVRSGDYDLGLVTRPDGETTGHPEMTGLVNAGVMFFANTAATRGFVESWIHSTRLLRNDQLALNALLFQETDCWQPLPEEGGWRFAGDEAPETLSIDGLTVRLFDPSYNSYLFPLPATAKIAHFKGKERRWVDGFLDWASAQSPPGESVEWPPAEETAGSSFW